MSQINHALENSETWGEFKRLAPAEEYQRLVEMVEFEDEDQTEPDPDEPFDGIVYTGDGDYPDWLQPEMDDTIPLDILQKFGKRGDTFLNGSYWHIPEENMEPMAEALRASGFVVEAAQDLPFS